MGPVAQLPGSFLVRVIRAEAGDASAQVTLDLSELAEARPRVEQAVLMSAVATRRLLTEPEQTLQGVGQTLFTALLGTAGVHTCYREALALAERRDEGLRVVVRTESADLAALPWESMYDPVRHHYVCLRDQVTRHVPVPALPAPLRVQPPLAILGVTASPRGLMPLDVDHEREQLHHALAPLTKRGLARVDWVEQASWASLQEALVRRPYQCLHFIGHGDFDTESDAGALALVGQDGRANVVDANRFVNLLRTARPIPRLVVLNSCLGAATGVTDQFAGTASALVRGGVSAVVAMQYQITDQAAVEFTRGFYGAVAHGRGLDEAVACGRVAVLGLNRQTLEWVTPVLYLRGDNPHLFSVSSLDAPTPSVLHFDDSRPVCDARDDKGRQAEEPQATDDAEEARLRGERLCARRSWQEAEVAFREAIHRAPGQAVSHYGLGNALWGQRRAVEAEAAFREAVRRAPTHAAPLCGLGNALRDQARAVEAEAAFHEAIRLNPTQADAHYGLGCALRDQHRAAEAEDAFREAITLAPLNPLAHRGLGNALSDQGRNREALAHQREADRLQSARYQAGDSQG
jgi:Flp pilus assembly protein TadD